MKKLLFLLTITGILAGCSGGMETAQVTGPQGTAGSSCTATSVTGGVNIVCGNNAPVFLPNGSTGATGSTGAQGPQGIAGTSCTATAVSNGVNITCGSNAPVLLPSDPATAQGLECTVYAIQAADESGTVNWSKMFTDGTIFTKTTIPNINFGNQSDMDTFPGLTTSQQATLGYTNFAYDCHGYLNAPVTGQYGFAMYSDDGSELLIDGNVIINMPQVQAYTGASNSNVNLLSGLHEINVFYFQGPATNVGWTLEWQGPSNAGLGTLSVIPTTAFTQ